MSFEYAMLPNRKEGIPHNVGASSALYYVTIPPHINLEARHEVFGNKALQVHVTDHQFQSQYQGEFIPCSKPRQQMRLSPKMTLDDLNGVMEIEKLSFISPWTERFFEEALASPVSLVLVLRNSTQPIGYIILYSVADEAHILNIAIHQLSR